MKYFYLLVFYLVVINSSFCQENINHLRIEYSKISRGFYEKIEVSKDLLVIKVERKDSRIDSFEITTKKWNKILVLVNKMDLKILSNLKAPSNKRFYDGAAIAQLKIKFKDTIYQSSNFDHGNPPSYIKELIDSVLEMKNFDKN